MPIPKPCGKQIHANEFEAARTAVALSRKGLSRGNVNVYYCTGCGGFHWGHVVRERAAKRGLNGASPNGEAGNA
jgi:hypothetical protein